jgi:hypothetical protein
MKQIPGLVALTAFAMVTVNFLAFDLSSLIRVILLTAAGLLLAAALTTLHRTDS